MGSVPYFSSLFLQEKKSVLPSWKPIWQKQGNVKNFWVMKWSGRSADRSDQGCIVAGAGDMTFLTPLLIADT